MRLNKKRKRIEIEELVINGVRFLVKIHFENRNNARVSINRESINIRIPYILNYSQRYKEIAKLKLWAEEKIKSNLHKFKQQEKRIYKDSEILRIGNREYILSINFKDKKGSSAKLIDGKIILSVSSNLSEDAQNRHISVLISRIIGKERIYELEKRINSLNRKYFNKNVNKISFKHLRSRWGSCSSRGNINISTRLLFAPEDVLKYVCIHELAHLIESNHSARFWKLVKQAMPDYKEKKKWLKENRDKCSF